MISRKSLVSIILFIGLTIPSFSQKIPDKDLLDLMCDTLTVMAKEHFRTESVIELNRALKRSNKIDLYFTQDISFFPWHKQDQEWFRHEAEKAVSGFSCGLELGELYAGREKLGSFCTHDLGNSGDYNQFKGVISDPRTSEGRFIRKAGKIKFPKGLDDRYIAVWQSHGLYYDEEKDYWHFQRAPLFRTVEDLFTQSFVIPFLIPMLENAGAYVLTPRERDINPIEYVVDNDRSFSETRTGLVRRKGRYSETGAWESAGSGFADISETYDFSTNPFVSGTARQSRSSAKKTSSARWTPPIENRGEYAVYVSYKSLDNSSDCAHYTVRHMGGEDEFYVNQRIGGGTWIYLGTFEFDEGDQGWVELDNSGKKGSLITADGVRFGGGMGKIARGGNVSGAKSHVEGALYSMVWAGVGEEITQDKTTEYINEYSSRGAWTNWMKQKKGIPFDLSIAFHSNAGMVQQDSTYGTLAIYTRKSEDGVKFKDGRDRNISRLLCDFVQSQVVNDIRAGYNAEWTNRGIWDKNYNESRTTGVPGMILELLSHQNFNDMKLGLDPSFRFTVSRAVYKGILKTISDFYGCPYSVQPLPVKDMSVRLTGDDKILLSWNPSEDPLEPTANPEGYIVYTRVDGGAFDNGKNVNNTVVQLPIKAGHIYSYKVVPYNDGGYGFPSEILSAGIPLVKKGQEVLIVNNFTKISAPYYVDTQEYAGFDGRFDSGVPYIRDISYAGDSYEFDRNSAYVDDDYPGFGASHTDHAGETIAGNTFDYPYLHGRILMELGRPFTSMSSGAFCHDGSTSPKLIDIICGKQGLTQDGGRYGVFTDELKEALKKSSSEGSCFFISGANIASDSTATGFTEEQFGYSSASHAASSKGIISGMAFHHVINSLMYCVECPDGLKPTSKSETWLRYDGTGISAAVKYNAGNYRSVSVGTPLETLVNEKDRIRILSEALQYLDGNAKNVNHQ